MGWVIRLDPLPIDDRVAETWAWLRVQLREAGRRMPVNDSWIAATAMALGFVVTQDDDYEVGIPELEVIRVWPLQSRPVHRDRRAVTVAVRFVVGGAT